MAKSRPGDFMQVAKAVVDEATGQDQPTPPPISEQLRTYMKALGKMGGKKGGIARDKALTKKRKKEIGQAGAKARWGKRKA